MALPGGGILKKLWANKARRVSMITGAAVANVAGQTSLGYLEEKMRGYYGTDEYSRKYQSAKNQLSSLLSGAAWYVGITQGLNVRPGWAVTKGIGRGVLGTAKRVGAAAKSAGSTAWAWEGYGSRTREKDWYKYFGGATRQKTPRQSMREYRKSRIIPATKNVSTAKEQRVGKSKIPGLLSFGVAAYAGYRLGNRLPTRSVAEGNIVGMEVDSVSEKMNFSTAGIVQALHNSRRRME